MRLLLTYFGPYEHWGANSSQMAVDRLDHIQIHADVTQREYPVQFDAAHQCVLADHESSFDTIVHVGQSKRAERVELEMLAVNFGRESDDSPYFELQPDGPLGYHCRIDLAGLSNRISTAGIPVEVSFHAGVFICNAVYYWSQHAAATHDRNPTVLFVHLPLDPKQREQGPPGGSLPIDQSALALQMAIEHALKSNSVA